MRWDYPPLDINPVFPGLGDLFIIIIITTTIIIIFIIIINIIIVNCFYLTHPLYMALRSNIIIAQ